MTAIVVVLVILGLLLLTPIGAQIAYKADMLTLKLRIGQLRIGILPKKEKKAEKDRKPKPKKIKEKKKTKKPDNNEPQKKKKRGLSFWLDLISFAIGSLKKFFRGLVIEKLDICAVIADEDRSKTALNYGRICAALEVFENTLDSFRFVRDYNIHVEPDFTDDKMKIEAETEITLLLYSVFGMIFCFAFSFLRMLIKNKITETVSRRKI